jgi:hypothetical protein
VAKTLKTSILPAQATAYVEATLARPLPGQTNSIGELTAWSRRAGPVTTSNMVTRVGGGKKAQAIRA